MAIWHTAQNPHTREWYVTRRTSADSEAVTLFRHPSREEVDLFENHYKRTPIATFDTLYRITGDGYYVRIVPTPEAYGDW